MPIVVWLIIPDDWIDLSKRFDEFAHVTLQIFGKLPTVQNFLIVTSSASFCVNAVFACFLYLAYVRFSIRFSFPCSSLFSSSVPLFFSVLFAYFHNFLNLIFKSLFLVAHTIFFVQ